MDDGFLITVLAILSALTSLSVEAIKKILDEKGMRYSSNLLAMIVAIVLTIAVCIGYVLYYGIPITVQTIVIMIALVFLSFLSSTVTYDKVKQFLLQIGR